MDGVLPTQCVCSNGIFQFIRDIVTELDRENPDFPPYLISHGQKIESTRVLLATRLEVADFLCVHCKSDARNVDATYAP